MFCHATARQFTTFAPYQHFGSLEAAEARAEARPSKQHEILKVWLRIRNPWKTFDDQASNNVSRLVTHAQIQGLFQPYERDQIHAEIQRSEPFWHGNDDDYPIRKWQFSMAIFARELLARGYDGLEYENTVEGGTSYVPLKTDQIWWATRDSPET